MASSWFYYKEICYDEWSHERKNKFSFLTLRKRVGQPYLMFVPINNMHYFITIIGVYYQMFSSCHTDRQTCHIFAPLQLFIPKSPKISTLIYNRQFDEINNINLG